MSLPDTDRTRRSFPHLPAVSRLIRPALGITACAILAAGLSACQVRPLYGTLPGTQAQATPVQDKLAAIEIESIDNTTSVESDAKRELYNELTFLFERGAEPPQKLYRLKILMDLNVAEVGVEELTDVPAAYTMTANATFVLEDKATETTLMTGKSFATASYDFSNQRFANIRAKRNARLRAARVVANDIQARIAGYFATH